MKNNFESRKTSFYRYLCLLPATMLQIRNTPDERGPFRKAKDCLVKRGISVAPYHHATLLTQRKKRHTIGQATELLHRPP